MSTSLRSLLVVFGLIVAFSAGYWIHAQVPVQPFPQPGPRGQTPGPTVIAGDDIGFRVERQNGGIPVGRLVVRVDGVWIQPEFAMDVQRLSGR
jgi:hypothetical protein